MNHRCRHCAEPARLDQYLSSPCRAAFAHQAGAGQHRGGAFAQARPPNAPLASYIAAWKPWNGTGAGGRGGIAAANQPVSDWAARTGIPATTVVAPHKRPMTVVSRAGTCGCAGSMTMGGGAGRSRDLTRRNGARVLDRLARRRDLRGDRLRLCRRAPASAVAAACSSGGRGVAVNTVSAVIAAGTAAVIDTASGALVRLLSIRAPTTVTTTAGTSWVTSFGKNRAGER